VQVHLVDATYELFRAHYAPRPPVLGRDGVVLSGVSGLCDQLLFLLRSEEPNDPDLVAWVQTLNEFALVEQIAIVEAVQVEALAQLRRCGGAIRLH